ncbi:hypothetical protein BDQ12DRAFT_713629 [Crucibulum laeve]|uniref:Uncharacterized protein n=1 Tax=Crucibulum laeve TaxID=68775 RepID=A0A5C3M7V9_9AGAR|nr:hypothetical protein BDQ12DRAFT_713629 [Crucibulum laeve]
MDLTEDYYDDSIEGMDMGGFHELVSNIPTNTLTGLPETTDIMKYLLENSDDPAIRKVMEHSQKMVMKMERDDDFSELDFGNMPVLSDQIWRIFLQTNDMPQMNSEPSGLVQKLFDLVCFFISTSKNNPEYGYRLLSSYDQIPNSNDVLRFIQRCVAKPNPGTRPYSLPGYLTLSTTFDKHTNALRPILNSLSASFKWGVENRAYRESNGDIPTAASQHMFTIQLVQAQLHKDTGNTAFSKDKSASLKEYLAAIHHAELGLAHAAPSEDELNELKRLKAICHTNRAVVFSVPVGNKLFNISAALEDAQLAVDADPTYMKGYIRLSRSYEMKGNVEKAKEVIIQALHQPESSSERVTLETHLNELEKFAEKNSLTRPEMPKN